MPNVGALPHELQDVWLHAPIVGPVVRLVTPSAGAGPGPLEAALHSAEADAAREPNSAAEGRRVVTAAGSAMAVQDRDRRVPGWDRHPILEGMDAPVGWHPESDGVNDSQEDAESPEEDTSNAATDTLEMRAELAREGEALRHSVQAAYGEASAEPTEPVLPVEGETAPVDSASD